MREIYHLLHSYDEMKTTEAQQNYIDSVERFIQECRDVANTGSEAVPDSVYDAAIALLKKLRPDSYIFDTTWSKDDTSAPLDADLDAQLVTHPMLSIQTIKDLSDSGMKDFAARIAQLVSRDGSVELHASMKMNGHGIRLVYCDGEFVKAHTRGRSSNGRDITRSISLIVPTHVPSFEGLGIVELRGELCLPYSNFDKALAFKPDIKSPFTGVSAMIRESGTDEEHKLLRFVAYALYSDSVSFDKLSDMYQSLQAAGFETPIYEVYDCTGDAISAAAEIIDIFEGYVEDYDYFTDGVVLSVNDLTLLHDLGTEKSWKNGNVALKVGHWQQDLYYATVEEIQWKDGRQKLTPVARVTPTLTTNGATVTNVPLYAPIHILNLEAYPGNTIYFKFGGEAGVLPCHPDGSLVTD